jgi:hypothetical protein
MDRHRTEIKIRNRRIATNPHGFSSLARIHDQLAPIYNCDVTLDFANLSWLDGHLAGPLIVIVRRAEQQGNLIRIANAQDAVAKLLRRNRFLQMHEVDENKTSMPLTEFALEDAVAFSLYAKKHLAHKEMPRMSKALIGKFFEGIDELFANSALHSNSPVRVAVCGQFFPSKGRLDFVLTDGGRGIPGAVRKRFPDREFSDEDAIAWAMEPYNTTRQGDIPGGLGSKLLREFVALNQGRLAIASQGGYWCQTGKIVAKSSLSCPYPGTSVLLEINTADRNRYDLVSAPRPTEIW